MTPAESVRLVAMLGAYFGREIDAETAALWTQTLVGFELVDGMDAVQLLGATSRRFPTLADLSDTIREFRADRLKSLPKTSVLPPRYTLSQFLSDHPDMRKRFEALSDSAPEGNPIVPTLAWILEDEIAGGSA
jgi:hypothetical protein